MFNINTPLTNIRIPYPKAVVYINEFITLPIKDEIAYFFGCDISIEEAGNLTQATFNKCHINCLEGTRLTDVHFIDCHQSGRVVINPQTAILEKSNIVIDGEESILTMVIQDVDTIQLENYARADNLELYKVRVASGKAPNTCVMVHPILKTEFRNVNVKFIGYY
ncbi:hypothetical protein GEMRC1_001189 [Eukaryota sp. GEM-RC1]